MDQYKQGDILIIELKTGEIYDGILSTQTKDEISLCNAVEYPSGKFFENICHFSTQEVTAIRLISGDERCTSEFKNVNLKLSEYKHFTNLINSYELINQMDSRFFQMLNHLTTQQSVAVDCKGNSTGRFRKISYIILATWNQVFVIDVTVLGFHPRLKQFFESNFILKIVHDTQKLKDCLKNNYNINLKHAFDTLVADYKLQIKNLSRETAKPRQLDECVVQYFNLPKTFVDNVNEAKWEERPLPYVLRELIAIRASVLLFLKRILEKKFNESVYNITNDYYQMFRIQPAPLHFPENLLE